MYCQSVTDRYTMRNFELLLHTVLAWPRNQTSRTSPHDKNWRIHRPHSFSRDFDTPPAFRVSHINNTLFPRQNNKEKSSIKNIHSIINHHHHHYHHGTLVPSCFTFHPFGLDWGLRANSIRYGNFIFTFHHQQQQQQQHREEDTTLYGRPAHLFQRYRVCQ